MSEPPGPAPAGWPAPGEHAPVPPAPGAEPAPGPPAWQPPAVPTFHRAPRMPGLEGRWQRLHPLSPLVRAGRGLAAIAVVLLVPYGERQSTTNDVAHIGIVVAVLVLGAISWAVTRWRVEAGVLRVDSGLIRRTSKRFPLSQMQAIDTVRPGLARVFGLSELRIRLAGGARTSGRLAYLTASHAELLRARLLAMRQQAPTAAAEQAPERTLATVAPARLAASLLLTGPGLWLELAIAALIVLAVLAPAAATAALGGGTAWLAGFALPLFRRFNGGYRLTVSLAGDGLRLRSGLVETAAETIPPGRVQAIRMVEPLLWRAFGWCRVEVDVAGQKARGRQDRDAARAVRAVLPVGSRAQATMLVDAIFPARPAARLRPPARARMKSPLRYRQLSWGANDRYAVTTSGRVRRATDWVPLAKVQSIRHREGPLQRALGLASVHLDTAGRNVHAVARDRDRREAADLLRELPGRCRAARQAERRPAGQAGGG